MLLVLVAKDFDTGNWLTAGLSIVSSILELSRFEITSILIVNNLSCSFADLQKPQAEIDGKACAAVGQNSLMALYDTLFIQVAICV